MDKKQDSESGSSGVDRSSMGDFQSSDPGSNSI